MKIKKTQFIVGVREIWVQPIRISANDPDDAIQRVLDGEGDLIENELDYSSTMDPENWGVWEETSTKAREEGPENWGVREETSTKAREEGEGEEAKGEQVGSR